MRRSALAWMALMAVGACAPSSPVAAPEPVDPCEALRIDLPLGQGEAVAGARNQRQARPSPTGEAVVFVRPVPGGGSQIVLASPDGSRALTDGASQDLDPVFDPGGERVFFASDRAGSFDIWSADLHGGDLRRLTDTTGDERHPDPSPTPFEIRYGYRVAGHPRHQETLAVYRKVLFEHCDADRCQIAVVASDGTLPETLTPVTGSCRTPRWAPSGEELTYACDGTVEWVAYHSGLRAYFPSSDPPPSEPRRLRWPDAAKLFSEGASVDPEVVARFEGFDRPVISPNGVWMLAEQVVGEERQLWALRRDGERHRVVAGSQVTDAAWSKDGKRVTFSTGPEHPSRCQAAAHLPLTDVDNLWLFPELYALRVDTRLARDDMAVFDRSAWFGSWPEPDHARGAPSRVDYRPQLITSDAILFAMHTVFDRALASVERDVLAPKLRLVLQRIHRASARAAALSHRRNEERLARHLAIAHALANEDGDRDPAQIIASVLPQGPATDAGVEEDRGEGDLSVLKPRGHYDTDGLRGYFRAMTWLGQFEVGGAALCATLSELIDGSGVEKDFAELNALYDTLVGPPALPGPRLIADIARDHPAWFEPTLDDAAIGQEAARRLQAAGTQLASSDAGCYVVPARWTPDAAMMEKSLEVSRRAPSAIDVMAMLGSDRAALHLSTSVPALEPFVPRGAYGHWLAALQTLILPLPTGAVLPPFARSAAHRDKLLTTALAGYTTLKHDTILTARPPRVRMGGHLFRDEWLADVAVQPRPLVYVEPTPGLYDNLAHFAQRLAEALEPLGPEARSTADRLQEVQLQILSPLEKAVTEQLAGRPLDDELYARIREIGEHIRHNWHYGSAEAPIGPFVPRSTCLVVDVWSDPVVRRVHALAVGEVQPLAVIIPDEGRRLIATGGAYTFYAMDLPFADRPTDARWCERVRTGNLPPRPSWTSSFLDAP